MRHRELHDEWIAAETHQGEAAAFGKAIDELALMQREMKKKEEQIIGLEAAYDLALNKCVKLKSELEECQKEAIHSRDQFHKGEPYILPWE